MFHNRFQLLLLLVTVVSYVPEFLDACGAHIHCAGVEESFNNQSKLGGIVCLDLETLERENTYNYLRCSVKFNMLGAAVILLIERYCL